MGSGFRLERCYGWRSVMLSSLEEQEDLRFALSPAAFGPRRCWVGTTCS